MDQMSVPFVRLTLLLWSLLLMSCSTTNTHYDASQPHHTPTGFRNNDIGTVSKSMADVWRWLRERGNVGPRDPAAAPTVTANLPAIHANAQAGRAMQPSATWIGHASVLVQASGLNVLTDPIFSERASPVALLGPQRKQPPGLAVNELPRVDVVVISHNHFDHLDRNSVLLLAAQAGGSPLFLVPLGVKPWLAKQGIERVVELDWWQSHRVGEVDFFLTPVQHWSGRSLSDRHHSLWGGWAALGPDFHWYFSGDTGYSSDFAATRRYFAPRQPQGGFDLALLAIGAYEPNWFMKDQHVNPREAVRIHHDLNARRSVGIHWGTFDLSDEPLGQPPRDLARERQAAGLAADDFSVMAVGETRVYPQRNRPSADALPLGFEHSQQASRP